MKREIVCIPTCQNKLRAMFPNNEPYPGEYLTRIPGKAKKPFVCDHCGERIEAGDLCLAFSISTDHAPYQEWEHEFIDKLERSNDGTEHTEAG